VSKICHELTPSLRSFPVDDYLVMALQGELKTLEEADIDADFTEMADNEEY
jgi:hypothetical protein